ncbi:MAG: hypothetical protein R3C97_02395 [Geminicoccaceae bacterium]
MTVITTKGAKRRMRQDDAEMGLGEIDVRVEEVHARRRDDQRHDHRREEDPHEKIAQGHPRAGKSSSAATVPRTGYEDRRGDTDEKRCSWIEWIRQGFSRKSRYQRNE